jgi:hypothetical protein
MDIIRVLRLIEYVGPRDLVEKQITQSVQGVRVIQKPGGRSLTIRVVTLGEVSEILGQEKASYFNAYSSDGRSYGVYAGQFQTVEEALGSTPDASDPRTAYILRQDSNGEEIVFCWNHSKGEWSAVED